MKKLKLDLDALRVESFDTDADAREQGTVHAHALHGVQLRGFGEDVRPELQGNLHHL